MSPLLDRLVDGMALPEDPKLIIKLFLRNPHPTARLMKAVAFRRDGADLVVSSDDFIMPRLKCVVDIGKLKMYRNRIWLRYNPEQGGEAEATRIYKKYVQLELMWRAEESGSCGGRSDN